MSSGMVSQLKEVEMYSGVVSWLKGVKMSSNK